MKALTMFHVVDRNASGTQPAKFLVLLIKDKRRAGARARTVTVYATPCTRRAKSEPAPCQPIRPSNVWPKAPPSSRRKRVDGESAMRILIAGATGAIGRLSVRRLTANQHKVFALTRSARFRTGVGGKLAREAVMADALNAAAVKAAVGRIRPDAVINELTSLPRHYTPAEMTAAAERDRKVRVEGNINLLAALRDAGRAALPAAKFPDSGIAPGAGLADESVPFISSASPGVEASGPHVHGIGRRAASATPGIEFVAPTLRILLRPRQPGTHARAIWVIRCGDSRFRLSVRAKASTASCISTMAAGATAAALGMARPGAYNIVDGKPVALSTSG